ncbi:bifunctional phosphopantothenoylcysteine decarboxylase/phosphopantothenate--cysteine ligase CoaBC [Sphaerobacter thermophilus]|uniref:Coenzyme A biosynthesis bifunctional protein CoaBC n=1 Tax=Sphaerobacter thermophilus (strain ATCC 49802 / DSM 20745 / KCCM 41009 / NCIMB 13125 / S 6022) TaxID=479434 RepID=D1C2J6_SPHTD|nr:bifunctional phosphopantothenoylcysteine decarboxylase/phosphopantothenate--cysteine ligase CoaBC [Sphaerobacter thermophilus]ACZ38463.1 phosphopantothenoylcysteine decarboxylase/phosphopantothenate/cysteine ligase [Sphaerobacter thermophilus DSM 20745]
MTTILKGKRIVLGVSGGIAAYKSVELARELTLAGAQVDVVMTRAAREFVGPLTFETLTRRPVRTEVFEQWTEAESGHVSLGERADLMIIAPATAQVIAKLAHGLADDMLSVTALATPAPVIVAPAMDYHMYQHPATQANLRTLADRGVRIVGPDEGLLASGLVGPGRLVPTTRLMDAIRATLGSNGPLAGVRVVVTAGPTREPLDPLRFLSNRSSGKMGYALVAAAIDAGASVTLITGPTALTPHSEASVIGVESAAEMADAVQTAVQDADVLIMTAAVADYRPASVAEHKIKKSSDDLTLNLTRTTDILASIDRPGLLKVGFAAETTSLLDYARDKLRAKHLDLIVANDARTSMGSDEGWAYLLEPGKEAEEVGPTSKAELAEVIIDRVASLLRSRRTSERD